MPKVIKRETRLPPSNGSPAVAVDCDDPFAGAVPVADLRDEYLRFTIYGQNRTGKTTLACQFPKPLLLVAFEPHPTGGAKSVVKVPGVIVVRYTASERGLALCKVLTDSGGAIPQRYRAGLAAQGFRQDCFASYVVDGATSYQDIILKEVMGWEECPEQLAVGMVGKERYQERAERVKRGLRPFFSLPGHVVILAKEKDHNPPKDDYSGFGKLTSASNDDYVLRQESYFAEDVGGSVAEWLHDNCEICRLYIRKELKQVTDTVTIQGKKTTKTRQVETGKLVRRLRTLFHPNFAAGLRSENPDCVPEFIEATRPEEMYAKLMKVVRGEKIL